MRTIGVVGVGKIGLPIADNLIKSGHRVVGYRRSSLAEFEKIGGVPARSAESDAMSRDLKRRGFRFVGTTICYALMQASGMVNDHLISCPRHSVCARLARL